MLRSHPSQNVIFFAVLMSCVSVDDAGDGTGFAANWGGITHLTVIHCVSVGHFPPYIIDLSPKRQDEIFDSERCEVSLMQQRCKEAEFSLGVMHFGFVCACRCLYFMPICTTTTPPTCAAGLNSGHHVYFMCLGV